MEYRCSACHTPISADTEPHVCPKCGVEAGLELQYATPLPMKLFGALLGSVLLASLAGGVLGMLAGH